MPVRLCSRCQGDLPSEVDGDLTYCPHCGAPQIVLSEDLRDQFEQQRLAAQSPSASHPDAVPVDSVTDPTATLWQPALQLIGLAGALFALLLLVAFAFPALSVFALLWTLIAPIVLLGAYATRHPSSRITTRFGARFGMLTGLCLSLVGLSVNSLRLLAERFLLHRGPQLDQAIAQVFTQMQTQPMQQQLAAQQPAEYQQLLAILQVPEFRIGIILASCALVILLYTVYTTLSGAFSGLLRSRARAAL